MQSYTIYMPTYYRLRKGDLVEYLRNLGKVKLNEPGRHALGRQ